jgi:hypothetical protein
VTRYPAALLPGLSVAVPAAALKIIPCISRVPFGALSAIWPPSICSVDQYRPSSQCAGIRTRTSASCSVSGIGAIVQCRPVSL